MAKKHRKGDRKSKRIGMSRNIIVLTVFISLLSISCIELVRYGAYRMMDSYEKIVLFNYRCLEKASIIRQELYNHQSTLYHHILVEDDNDHGGLRRRLDEIEEKICTYSDELQELVKGTEYESDCHEIDSDVMRYLKNVDVALEFHMNGDKEKAKYYMESALEDIIGDLNPEIDELYVVFKDGAHDEREEMEHIMSLMRTWSIRVLLFLIVCAILSIYMHIQMSMRLLNQDILTSVYNFDKLINIGEKYKKKDSLKNYSMIAVNIKNFKYINQEYGSQIGDEVLQKYAVFLSSKLGRGEAVARNGADNFFILKKKDTVEEYIEKIKYIPVEINASLLVNIRSRCGIYQIEERSNIQESISCALLALGESRKDKNKDVVWFSTNSRETLLSERNVIEAFGNAIRTEEFVVYYQPKVDIFKHELCGTEALVRWIRNGKVLPPMEFVPILEKEKLITKLDFYVFEHVCMDLRRWIDEGIKPVRVSSNFSKDHLANPTFTKMILKIINKYNVPHEFVEIELTESSGYDDYEALSKFVTEMKKEGIYTAMDDFGTGYSSLSLLRDIEMNVIKLDRSFLRNFEKNDKKDRSMIENIVRMIHELDRTVICEGVETRSQADFLRSINCRQAQGFLYDRPLPREEFEQKLKKMVYED